MVAFAEEVPEATLLVQVHDELLCEVPQSSREMLVPRIVKALERVWPEAPVAFPIRSIVGSRWGSLGPYR